MKESVEQIAIKDFGSSNPGPGCSFIASDGTFINIYPQIDDHEDLCEYLSENYGVTFEYPDADWFVKELGWIRLRSDPYHIAIILSSNRPTNMQFYSLEDWLQYCEDRYQNESSKIAAYIDICDEHYTHNTYDFMRSHFAEDIVKACTRYYTSGKLYASTNIGGSHMLTGTEIEAIKSRAFEDLYNDPELSDYYSDMTEFEMYMKAPNNYDKDILYHVDLGFDRLWGRCFDEIQNWEAIGYIDDMLNEATAEQLSNESDYYDFIVSVYKDLIDMWMNDIPPVEGDSTITTYTDFAEDYCEEYGEPAEITPPDYYGD